MQFVINLDEKQIKGTRWVSLFIQLCNLIFLRLNITSKKVLSKTKDKSTTHNIFRIQDDDSIVWILLYCFHRKYHCRKDSVR